MTRARALKQTIRARAAQTGERYTTARRHVLNEAAKARVDAPRPAAKPAASSLTKGAVSDARVTEKTGQALDHWFDVLDRFGGPDKGHTALARHLHETHDVERWYAQGITVAYERARGVRTLNQRVSGEYEMSVTKTVAANPRAIVKAFTDARRRRRWLEAADEELTNALSRALTAKTSKGFVIRPDGMGRYRYRWGTTTVQLHLIPKGPDRTSVVITHMKLSGAVALEERRAQWRVALAALARHLDD